MRLMHLDLETGGLDPLGDSVLSIAQMTYDTVCDDFVSVNYQTIHGAEDPSEAEARAVNHITGETSIQSVYNSDPLHWLAEELIRADIIVGWGLAFDLDFLHRFQFIRALIPLWRPCLCLKSWWAAETGKVVSLKPLVEAMSLTERAEAKTATWPKAPPWFHNALFDCWQMALLARNRLYRDLDSDGDPLVSALVPRASLRNLHKVPQKELDASLYYVPMDYWTEKVPGFVPQWVHSLNLIKNHASTEHEERMKSNGKAT